MYKIDKLLKEQRQLFHTNDLALLWAINNRNTLYTTIKRYIQKGILIPIHKGFYSAVPLEKINPLQLGISYLHQYSYVSLEYVLSQNGFIFQPSPYITLVSSVSKKFTIGPYWYWSRRLKDVFLYNQAGIENKDGVALASCERAIADMLYFNPYFNFDQRKISWLKVKAIQKEVGYR